ncbi:hypothetical protein [Archangium sp.]
MIAYQALPLHLIQFTRQEFLQPFQDEGAQGRRCTTVALGSGQS